MSRLNIPTWSVAAVIVVVFALVAGLLFLLFEGLPPSVSPQALEERFKDQIDFLKTMAADHPGSGYQKEWWRQVEAKAGLFSDPVILGVSIYVCHEPRRFTSVTVKSFEAPRSSMLESWIKDLSQSETLPDVGRPTLVHWHAGGRRLVKYRNLFLDASGKRKGYQLVLDLDRIVATCESTDSGARTSSEAR